jgi:hypothetical protein
MEDVIAEQSVSGYFVFCLQVSLKPRVVSISPYPFFFFLYCIADLNLIDFIEHNLRIFPFYIFPSFNTNSYVDNIF